MQSPLPQIMQSVFPHLGKSEGSAHPEAMDKPCPGKTNFGIMVSSLAGKTQFLFLLKSTQETLNLEYTYLIVPLKRQESSN